MEVYGNIRLVGNSRLSQPTNPVEDIEDIEVVTR
jgi:hypothetical protein